MHSDRRQFLAALPVCLAAGAVQIASPAIVRAADQKWSTAVPVTDFVPPNLGKADAPALQAAFDASLDTGLPLVFPRGEWFVAEPVQMRHVARSRRGFPQIMGAGPGSTILRGLPFAGPMISVRGAPEAPPAGTYFFWGGGFNGFTFAGARNGPPQNGMDVLGWFYGALRNCTFSGFTGHGVRAAGDLSISSNPDWSASMLRLEGCWFERIAGWGFLDDNPIGAPAWVFDQCLFVFCGAGGSFVRSSGHSYLGCSFSGCGFTGEETTAPGFGVGLRIGDADAFTINRTRVVVAEFDSNKDAHIMIDRATSFLIEDARFIHNDRQKTGTITPPVAVMLGRDHPRSLVNTGRITRPLVRVDHEGAVTGYVLAAKEARDIVIERESFTYTPGDRGTFERARGFPEEAERKQRNIVLPDESQ